MWKDCSVVMLPTNEKANIFIRDVANGRELFHSFPCLPQTGKSINSDVTAQHLYITSDEVLIDTHTPLVKIGDWVIGRKYFSRDTEDIIVKIKNFKDNEHGKYIIGENGEVLFLSGGIKKIIATTDESLDLPLIPQQFIQYFIEEYNKGNVISRVKVEYDLEAAIYNKTTEFCLKINPDNTVNIKQIKDSWSREEVIILFDKAQIDDVIKTNTTVNLFNKWIEENL